MEAIQNHTFETSEREISGVKWFVARGYRATPKGKYSKSKNVFAFRFRTEAERDTYLEGFKASLLKRTNEEEARKAAKAETKKNMVNPFKVGDLLWDSWGYEQTNIDFYQIVEVGKKSVKLRRIYAKHMGDCGFMSNYVAPDKDNFFEDGHHYGGIMTKILQVHGYDGSVYINGYRGSLWIWDKEKVTESHYA